MSVISNNVLAGAAGSGGAGAGYQIKRSLRFNDDDTAHLTKTYASAGNQKTWTWSGWIKLMFGSQRLIGAGDATASNGRTEVFINATGELRFYSLTHTIVADEKTIAQFKDYSAWYHVVVALDAGNSTAADRVKFYVNGVEQSKTVSTSTVNQNHLINSTDPQYIGARYAATAPFDGYMADVHFIDGQALDETSFGELDDNNVWQPKAYEGTYGTNGYHLDFSDNSSTSTLGTDSSGNSNTWTANNFSVASGAGNDSLLDSPTNYIASSGNNGGNYATFNPLDTVDFTFSNGNLDYNNTNAGLAIARSTIQVKSGKWYCEFTPTANASGEHIGITPAGSQLDTYAGNKGYSYRQVDGYKTSLANGISATAYGDTFTNNDVIGVAFDADNGDLYFYKNGTAQNSGTAAFTGIDTSVYYNFAISTSSGGTGNVNFGSRPFAYTPPAGYKSVCTTNLPDPTIEDGSTAMDVKLYTGNGTSQTISGLNFSPDLVWIKARSVAYWHTLYDTIRGAGDYLYSNRTDAANNLTTLLTAFNSDGFDVGSNTVVNQSGATYVAWSWDAGDTTVTNTDGTITSSVRANPSAGFSIVNYTGTGAAGTVGHGLNAKPAIVIHKNRDSAQNWRVFTDAVDGSMDTGYLNDTTAFANSTLTAPTSSVFNLGTTADHNGTGNEIIAYCFAPVEGYSAFGSYTGSGNFVYTGFRPRYILTKVTVTSSWTIWDTARNPYNLVDDYLVANDGAQEVSIGATGRYDILSNGFKVLSGSINANFYAAFAEHPFKTARAR